MGDGAQGLQQCLERLDGRDPPGTGVRVAGERGRLAGLLPSLGTAGWAGATIQRACSSSEVWR
ncbi:Hypothetical protein AA314_01321 [Archangium gephyra]|uniref:Uncharacterized protein n=1 Tax=Archangium gephyra TaxID=48 RepID=A0AAC8Q2A3_9BACT|nr:Hypothetical protein AA314_01321 [Archangium gephyra]